MPLVSLLAAALLAISAAPSLLAQKPADSTGKKLQARVWVNHATGVYHCPGSRYYGRTQDGEYMSEAQARARGNRAAEGTACPPGSPGAAPAPASGDSVWVNTASGVYFCPGHRSFGATREGRFMTQQKARAAGYRPAGGRACP